MHRLFGDYQWTLADEKSGGAGKESSSSLSHTLKKVKDPLCSHQGIYPLLQFQAHKILAIMGTSSICYALCLECSSLPVNSSPNFEFHLAPHLLREALPDPWLNLCTLSLYTLSFPVYTLSAPYTLSLEPNKYQHLSLLLIHTIF